LSGIEKSEGEIENFIFNMFISSNPVMKFKNKSEFRSYDDGASKGVLDVLETIYLRLF